MKFEEARRKFVDALMGHIVDGPDGSKGTDWDVNFPSKKVLDFLSTVNDPMDTQAILLLRDELPEDEYPTLAQGSRSGSLRSQKCSAPDGSYGRTSPRSCPRTEGKTLVPSSGKWGSSGILARNDLQPCFFRPPPSPQKQTARLPKGPEQQGRKGSSGKIA